MTKYSLTDRIRILNKACQVYSLLAQSSIPSNPEDPFSWPREKRTSWDDTGATDISVFEGVFNEVPYLLNRKGDEKSLSEWAHSLQGRMGIEPKHHEKIKSFIRQMWDDPKTVEDLYGDLMVFLREWARGDPWWKHQAKF